MNPRKGDNNGLGKRQKLRDGKYTIEKELGRGLFSITYRARRREGKIVALKALNEELRLHKDYERLETMFFGEAVKLAKCNNPHIVKVETPFKEGEIWCMPMEYIAGVDLAKRENLILPEEEALEYIRQVGEALSEVHRQGLLHRDIRPENIMVRAGKGEAVLIDFGLALDFDEELTQIRTEEVAKGFAPLELYSREGKRGPYTDIYGLGATL